MTSCTIWRWQFSTFPHISCISWWKSTQKIGNVSASREITENMIDMFTWVNRDKRNCNLPIWKIQIYFRGVWQRYHSSCEKIFQWNFMKVPKSDFWVHWRNAIIRQNYMEKLMTKIIWRHNILKFRNLN